VLEVKTNAIFLKTYAVPRASTEIPPLLREVCRS